MLVRTGTTFDALGERLTVRRLLGDGGQGEVYELVDPEGHPRHAMKWYFERLATPEQYGIIADLVARGAPGGSFVWPRGVISSPDRRTFGYLMPLVTTPYRPLTDLMLGRVDPEFGKLFRLGIELARGYLQLHGAGLCYRDINFGNAFFDPDTGRVLICDNDNVGIDGGTRTRVLGAPKFMAPEIVRREAFPSQQTDLYSLAVMLFYIFMIGHPLEGVRTETGLQTQETNLRSYGTDPLFVFDPYDGANAPVPGVHDHMIAYWSLYPRQLRDLFTRSFTEGLWDPGRRVHTDLWCKRLLRVSDSLVGCGRCGVANFLDPTVEAQACYACGVQLPTPVLIRIGGTRDVMLTPGRVLTSHHLKLDFDLDTPVAVALRHPRDASRIGLQILSGDVWAVTDADGRTVQATEGSTIDARPGLRIRVGGVDATTHRYRS